jgi:hypothetical protein
MQNEAEEESGEKEKEVEFINPMVFDRLGTEEGLFEIKYLVFLPLNGDPPLLSPEHGRIIHAKVSVLPSFVSSSLTT